MATKAKKADKAASVAAAAARLPANLQEIVELAKQQVELEERIAKGQALLEELTKRRNKISQEDLPDAMAEAGLKEFVLESGARIEIKEDFNVGIPEAERPVAFNWLEKNGYGGIIKCEVQVRFGKGELAKAVQLAEQLAKKKLEAKIVRNVPWQTLKAFVTERTRAAQPVPPEMFGVHQLNKAIIKLPKP